MSGRDKLSPLRLPLRVLLVLFICACSLAVHFVAEGLTPLDNPFAFDLAAQGGNSHLIHEHGEDHFVLSSLNPLQVVCSLTWPVSQAPACSLSILISPLLPPPNS